MKKGTKHTEESKIKMKGRIFSQEHRRKLSEKKRNKFGTKSNAFGHKLSDCSKKKISSKKIGIRVSIKTEFKKGDKRITGPNNVNWKGGKIKEHDKRDRRNTNWSKLALKRDNYTCKICGYEKKKQKDLVAHHIFAYRDYPELRFLTWNGITLCRVCHFKVHNSNKR